MGKIFLRGLLGLAPIGICIAVLIWLFQEIDYIFSPPYIWIFGQKAYFPGVGVIIGVIFLFFIGLILNTWLIQHLYNWFEAILKKTPLLKTVYTSVTDLMSFFRTGEDNKPGRVVLYEYAGGKMVGLVTRETFDDLPNIGTENEVTVFFPFSYQIGGITMIVPRSSITPLDISIEKGLRFVVTAGNPSSDKATFAPKHRQKPERDNTD